MKTTVYPKQRPVGYIGDLSLVQADCEQYNTKENAYVSIKEKTYTAAQLHNPANVVFYSYRDDRSININRQFGTRFSYHNYTKHTLLIVDRLNLPVTIASERRYYDGPVGLIIRKELYFDNADIAAQSYENVQRLGSLMGNELTKIMPFLSTNFRCNSYGRNISLEYFISEEDILNADGKLYHLPTDTVISFNNIDNTTKHPCSPEYNGPIGLYVENYPMGEEDVGMVFRYVSNDPTAIPKYIRVANKIFRIKPQLENPAKLTAVVTKDKKVELIEATEYIECLYPTKVDALSGDTKGYRCNRITLSEAREKYGIFDTLEEATIPLLSVEKAEAKLRDRIEHLETDYKNLSRESKERISILELQIKRKEIENEELKKSNHAETENIKEKREEQSHKRKLNFEFVKFLTGFIAAVLAIVPLAMKLRTK